MWISEFQIGKETLLLGSEMDSLRKDGLFLSRENGSVRSATTDPTD